MKLSAKYPESWTENMCSCSFFPVFLSYFLGVALAAIMELFHFSKIRPISVQNGAASALSTHSIIWFITYVNRDAPSLLRIFSSTLGGSCRCPELTNISFVPSLDKRPCQDLSTLTSLRLACLLMRLCDLGRLFLFFKKLVLTYFFIKRLKCSIMEAFINGKFRNCARSSTTWDNMCYFKAGITSDCPLSSSYLIVCNDFTLYGSRNIVFSKVAKQPSL